MQLDLLGSKSILVDELIPFAEYIQVIKLGCWVVVALHGSGFGIKMIRIDIKVKQIFCVILAISYSSQSLKLLIARVFSRQTCQLYWVNRVFELFVHILLPLLLFGHFTNLFILLVLVYHLFIHIDVISVPPISFTLPVQFNLLANIVRGNVFHGVFSSYFPGSLSALFSIMAHCSAVLAGSFSV